MSLNARHLACLLASAALLAPAPATADVAEPVRTAVPVTAPALDMLRRVAAGETLENVDPTTTRTIVTNAGRERVLYHLPAQVDGLRLAGEAPSRTWPVHVTKAQLAGRVTLRLGYKNAVSIMPEASRLEVVVNGEQIAARAIRSADRVRVLELDIPAHVLVPGANALTIRARQRHRVDCSIPATHELWTDLDAASSGFVFETGNGAIATLADLPALAKDERGRVHMRLVVPDPNDVSQVSRALELGQRIALHAAFEHPLVDVDATPGEGPGVDVFVGNRAMVAATAPTLAARLEHGEQVQVLASDAQERLSLVLLDGSERLPETLVSRFETGPWSGSASGRALLERDWNERLLDGEAVTLGELGMATHSFDGRLFRRAVALDLPADTYAADYDRAELSLSLAYAAGLSRDAKVIVRINGATATGLAMPRADGDVVRDKVLKIPLSAFRAGRNRIEIEARVGDPMDMACEPQGQIEGHSRFVLSERSSLRFPPLARLTELPDLRITLGTGFPYLRDGADSSKTLLAVARPEYAELSAAAAFTTAMALRSGKPLNTNLVYGAPPVDTVDAIVVGVASELSPDRLEGPPGLRPLELPTTWRMPLDDPPELSSLVAMAGVDRTTTGSIAPADALRGMLDGHVDGADTFRSEGNGYFVASLPVRPAWVETQKSAFVASQKLSAEGVWTVLTAASSGQLVAGVNELVRPGVADTWTGPTAALLHDGNGFVSSVDAPTRMRLDDRSFGNARLVLAGWFANHHFVYTGVMLAGLLGFGLLTNRTVVRSGVPTVSSREVAVPS